MIIWTWKNISKSVNSPIETCILFYKRHRQTAGLPPPQNQGAKDDDKRSIGARNQEDRRGNPFNFVSGSGGRSKTGIWGLPAHTYVHM